MPKNAKASISEILSKMAVFLMNLFFFKENTYCNAKTINFGVQKRPFFAQKVRIVTLYKVFKEKKNKNYLEMFESESIRLFFTGKKKKTRETGIPNIFPSQKRA